MILEVLGIEGICMSEMGERKDAEVTRVSVYICLKDPNKWKVMVNKHNHRITPSPDLKKNKIKKIRKLVWW